MRIIALAYLIVGAIIRILLVIINCISGQSIALFVKPYSAIGNI